MIIYCSSPPPCDVCDPRVSVAVGQRIGETLSSNMCPNEPVENVLKFGLAVGAVSRLQLRHQQDLRAANRSQLAGMPRHVVDA